MSTVRVAAIHLHRNFLAKLLPAGTAMIALGTSLIVMHHDALTDPSFLAGNCRTNRSYHTTRLVSGDHRIRILRKARGLARLPLGPAILMQVAAAHARGLHLHHDLVRAGRRIGELHHFQFATAGEHDTTHGSLL